MLNIIPILRAIVLCAVAIIINYFPLAFFTGSALVFGNIVALFATIVFGIRSGLAVSISSSIILYIHWDHLLAILPHAIEVVVIAWAIKQKRSILFVGTLYWLTLGSWIVAAEYFFLTEYLIQTKLAVIIKYVMNGIINVSLSYLFAACYLSLKNQPQVEQISMRKLLITVIFYAVSSTAIVSAYFSLQAIQKSKLSQLKNQLHLNAQHVSDAVENYISNTHNKLILLADLYNKGIIGSNFDQQFIELAKRDAGILTMITTDSSGTVTHTYPVNLIKNKQHNGQQLRVDKRFYFSEAKRTLKPVVSDVFQGRDFGNEPLIALSIPLIVDSKFSGIIEASLDLKNFVALDKKLISPEQKLLILDNKNRVIYHSAEIEYTFLQNLENTPLLKFFEQSEEYFYISNQGDYYIPAESELNSLGWRAITIMPRAIYEQEIVSIAMRSLFIYLMFILVFVLIISRLAESVSRPISELVDKLDKLKTTEEFAGFKLNIESNSIVEISQLVPVINNFSEKLRSSLNSLQTALNRADCANQKLAALNLQLNQLVEDKTQALRLALDDANKANEAKSMFLANMSHEIRTPLNGILGTLQLLQEATMDQQSKKFLEQALTSSRALHTILNDILDFSKIEEGMLTLESNPFDLNIIIESIYYSLVPEAHNKGIKLIVERANDFHAYWVGDAVRVRQIIQNIATNAVKFTQHGNVTLSITTTQKNDLKMTIEDTGIGMDHTAIARLFNRFEQADKSTTRKYGGSGLGMSISYNLAQLMNGEITVESEPNSGSKFTLILPLVKSNQQHLIDTQYQNLIPDFSNVRVLFAEDNAVNQLVIKAMLDKTHCKITLVANGIEALDAVNKQDFDLILLDIQMPEMDGLEACKQMRELRIETPIIALTANVMEHDIKSYLEKGFNAHISKPVEAQYLYKICASFINQS